MDEPRKQHYVPQTYLHNFGIGKKILVYMFYLYLHEKYILHKLEIPLVKKIFIL